MAAISADRRYTSGRRCPICDGSERDPRGQERRCIGFLAEGGTHAHCSREEHAGTLKFVEASQTYGHRLVGPCGCGRVHAAPVAERPVPMREVAIYDYIDETGVTLYQVVRKEGEEGGKRIKSFFQRRPPETEGGAWRAGLGDPPVRRVLYRLDRVLERPEGAIVWIVEGEKDVESLEKLGLVATTGPGGAGKWDLVAACAERALAGARVAIIPDDDSAAARPTDRDKGLRHALDVQRKLTGVAASASIVTLTGGAKDVTDWIGAGGTAEALLALYETTPVEKPSNRVDFERDLKTAKIYHTQANIRLALSKLGVKVKYDTFAHRMIVEGMADVAGGHLNQTARNRLRLLIDEQFQFRIAKDFWGDVIANEAWSSRFHPVVDYLAGLRWDGKRRIGDAGTPSWLTTYGGAADDPAGYTRAVGRLWLVAAVRRVRQPGCVFQEMLILEGAQGTNKSQMFRALAVRPEWLCDDLPINGETRDLMEQTTGRWLVICEELKGFAKAGSDKLKSYVSRTSDSSRGAYKEDSESELRQFVLGATTNAEGGRGYFTDHTGNRRYWPVTIDSFNLPAITNDIDQIWAEAAVAEASGEGIRLDPSLYSAAGQVQNSRIAVDDMEDVIDGCFGELEGKVRVTEAWKCTGIWPNRPLNRDESVRFAQSMRRCGWLGPKQFMVDGNKKTYYYRGNVPYRTISVDLPMDRTGWVGVLKPL